MITHEQPPCFDPQLSIQKGTLALLPRHLGVRYFPKKAEATCLTPPQYEKINARCGVRFVGEPNVFRGACPFYNGEVVEFEATQEAIDRLKEELARLGITHISYS